LAAGCWPLLPKIGAYAEILPKAVHAKCLYEPSTDHLSSRLMDVWHEEIPTTFSTMVQNTLKPFDAMSACRTIDERIEALVENERAAEEMAREALGTSNSMSVPKER
jgi:hypothetical protein